MEGKKFRHFKGGIYTVVCIACLEHNPEQKVVVYQDEAGWNWVRDFEEFFDTLPGGHPRFIEIV